MSHQQPASPQLPPPQAPSPQRASAKTWATRLAVGLFFAAQVWLPLSYYLSDYPWDERFSWRMFSTVRALECDVRAQRSVEAGERGAPCPSGERRCAPLRLSGELHMVWVNLLKRGRREVLHELARAQCLTPEGAPRARSLYVSLSCPAPTPPHPLVEVQSGSVDLCEEARP